MDDSGQAALSDTGSQAWEPGIRTAIEIKQQIFDFRSSDDDSNNMTGTSAIEPKRQLSINVDYSRSALGIPSQRPGVPLYRSIAIPPGFVLPMYRNFVNNDDPITDPNNLTSPHSAHAAGAAEVTSPSNTYPPNVVVPQSGTDQAMMPEHRSSVNSSSVVNSSTETEVAPASSLPINVDVSQTDQIPTSQSTSPSFHGTPAQLAYGQVPTETSSVTNEGIPVQMLSYGNMRTLMDSLSTQTTASTDVPETVYFEGNFSFHRYPSFSSINSYSSRQITREGEVLSESLVCPSVPETVIPESDVNSPQITLLTGNAVAPQQRSQAVINVTEADSSQEPTLMYLCHGQSNVAYQAQSMTGAEGAPRDSNEMRNFMMSQTALYNSLSSINYNPRCPTDARLVPESLYPSRNLVMSQESSVAIYPNFDNTKISRSSSECLSYPSTRLASDDDLEFDNNRLTTNYSISHRSVPMYHAQDIAQTGERSLGGVSLPASRPVHRNLTDMDSPYSIQSITDVETNSESFHFVPEASPSSSYHYQSLTDIDSPYSVQSSDIEAQGDSVYPVDRVTGSHNLTVPMYQVPFYGASVTPEQVYALGNVAVPQPIAATVYGLDNISSSFGDQSLGEAAATPEDALSVGYTLPQPIQIPLFHNVHRMSDGRSYSDSFYVSRTPQVHRDLEPINNLTHDFRDPAEANASSVPIDCNLGNIAQARFVSETNDPRNQTQSIGDVLLQRTVPIPLYLSTLQQIYFPASTHPINSLMIPTGPAVYQNVTNLGLDNSLEYATNYPNLAGLVPIYNMHNIPRGPLIPQVHYNSVQNSVQSIQAIRDAAARSEHGYYHPVFRS